MNLGIPTGVDTPLGNRLAGLTLLRLLVLTLFLGIIELYYNRELPFGGFSSVVGITTVGVAFLLSATYALLLRRGKHLNWVAFAQLATDQLTWTAVVYLSGGVTSGTTSLYGLTCLSGAILIGSRGAVFAAGFGAVSYVTLCLGFANGWLLPPVDQQSAAYVVDSSAMVYPAASTLLAMLLVTALAAYLAERFQSASGELRDATKRAERAERLAMLGRLSAALAHEIRNPLGSIRGSIELLRTGGELDVEDEQLCLLIEREADRVNDLVTDMVDLSRPRSPTFGNVDLAATARGVVDLARNASRGEDVRVTYRGPDELVVRADAGQMRQVLWNLVRNAIQASGADEEVYVELEREQQGDALMKVIDTGSGIPDSVREQIFDAFFTTRSHGVGIGLAVVKQITDAHGFGLEVTSDTNAGGTTFSIRFPKASVISSAALVVAVGLMLGGLILGGLMLGVVGCGGQEWVSHPINEAGEREAGGAEVWFADGAAPAKSEASAMAEDSEPAPALAAPSEAGSSAEAVDVPAASIETYRNTYYDFPSELAAKPGTPTRQLFDANCKPITTVSQTFHDQVCVQGSGRVAAGYTVSFAKRDCACAAECPRTAQKICFEKLEQRRFPFGRGASGGAITPLRTVAVDSELIPLGTVMYLPDYQGLRGPDGRPHDGCFIAEDRGLKVKGKHVDIFTGDPETTTSWNAAVPSNQGVRVILGASRCAHLSKAAKH